MRHDYDLPGDWSAMDSEARNVWLTQERCRRQAMRQQTPTARHIEKGETRIERRSTARPDTVTLADFV